MFYSEEEKREIREKWERVYIDKCDKCRGEGYIRSEGKTRVCECRKKALDSYKLEVSNFPIDKLEVREEEIKEYIKYDLDIYFRVIKSSIFKSKNLFLYDLSIDLNNMLIDYIGKKLVNSVNEVTKKKIEIYYVIFENLIQLSLRSNIDKEARDRLDKIMNKPDILIIDGLGNETGFGSSSKHNVKLLNLILKERNNKVKSTIISSKLYLQDIEKYYNKEIIEMIMRFDIIKR